MLRMDNWRQFKTENQDLAFSIEEEVFKSVDSGKATGELRRLLVQVPEDVWPYRNSPDKDHVFAVLMAGLLGKSAL